MTNKNTNTILMESGVISFMLESFITRFSIIRLYVHCVVTKDACFYNLYNYNAEEKRSCH
jgi:hypothetical protein